MFLVLILRFAWWLITDQNIQLSLLDENEKMVLSLYDDIIEKGDKIFHLNTTEHNNGTYYIAIKTPYQQILRKIKLKIENIFSFNISHFTCF